MENGEGEFHIQIVGEFHIQIVVIADNYGSNHQQVFN